MFLTGKQVLVVVVVFNRYHNLRVWINCWNEVIKSGFHYNAKFLVIHNHDYRRPNKAGEQICREGGVSLYLPRNNIGVDMGAFQDLCKDRLAASNPLSTGKRTPFDVGPWDIVFWAADDTIPMRRDFLYHFLNPALTPGIGAAGPEISNETSYHLRTNCFCIQRQYAVQLKFPRDPMREQSDAHNFEHQKYNMTIQLKKLGLTVQQINPDISYAAWDTGHRFYLEQWERHFEVFPSSRQILKGIR